MGDAVASEPTKVCPSCGERVLGAASVCKHCRHRFEGSVKLDDPADSAASLWVARWPLLLFGVLAVGLAIVALLGGESTEQSGRGAPDLSATQIESELSAGLESKTGSEVNTFKCEGEGASVGEQIRCEATFENGEEVVLLIDVEGTSSNPRLEVGLE